MIREPRRPGPGSRECGSSIARETSTITLAPRSELPTKAFLSQTILYLIALLLGRHQQMSLSEGQDFVRELRALPDKIQSVLDRASEIERIGSDAQATSSSSGESSVIRCTRGSLKKEISYLHAEGYAAGEDTDQSP